MSDKLVSVMNSSQFYIRKTQGGKKDFIMLKIIIGTFILDCLFYQQLWLAFLFYLG